MKISDVVFKMPRLCGLRGEAFYDVLASLKDKWQAEVDGKKFQRAKDQSIADRLAPGFEWMRAIQKKKYRIAAEYLRMWIEAAAFYIDKNTGKDIDETRFTVVLANLDELKDDPATKQAQKVAPVDAVKTMDFWN